jgi:hypothetical protein
MNKMAWTKKRKLLGVAVICVVLITCLTLWLNTGHVAEAAVLDPHPGLVGWWRFDEGSGSVAGDSSGDGNNGAIHGATWATGKYGQALSFDGSSNYVGIASFASLTGPAVSVEAWVNLSSQSTAYPDVVEITQSWGGVGGMKLQVWNHNQLWFRVWNAVASVEANTPKWTIGTGAWHNVVGTYDGSYAKLYIDGVLFGTGSLATNALNVGSPHLNIGVGFGSYFIKGAIDEVTVYNRALSAVEIQANSQKGPDFSSRLQATVLKGATQVITTLSWQGTGTINVTIQALSQNYTESMVPVYEKTVYSTSSGMSNMLNIKRLSVSISALSSDQTWYIILVCGSDVQNYSATVEIQK